MFTGGGIPRGTVISFSPWKKNPLDTALNVQNNRRTPKKRDNEEITHIIRYSVTPHRTVGTDKWEKTKTEEDI